MFKSSTHLSFGTDEACDVKAGWNFILQKLRSKSYFLIFLIKYIKINWSI